MDHLLIYDTETAGLTLEEGVVEHAWLEVDDDLNVLEEVRSLIKPPGAISPSAAGVHGITLDDVKDAPSMEQFMREIRGNVFADKKVLIIAHNAIFDEKYIAPFCREVDTICTLKLARRLYPDAENHKLPTLLHLFGLERRGTHNALDDVLTVRGLVKKMMIDSGLDLEGLYHLAKKPVPIKKMPFGKHKGIKLEDLPKSYVSWLLKQDNVDENLRWSLEQL